MGCSYDPVPMTIYPSPAELWMEENKFSEVKSTGQSILSICTDCGQAISGSRYGVRYLKMHTSRCPVNPRVEVSEKTEEQCKDHPRVIHV